MTTNVSGGSRILGRLRSAGGKGIVRIEDSFAAEVGDLWSALTDPGRLGHWLGEVEGDLRVGGEFRARFFASGWQGTGRVEACEPEGRLLVLTKDADEPESPDEHAIEVTLTRDGDETILAWEERGMPPELLAAYGAGAQIHVEDLASYLAGAGRCDPDTRWAELFPAYQRLADDLI
jgi:uncharacterized protein YndB with AHSA1/START domain